MAAGETSSLMNSFSDGEFASPSPAAGTDLAPPSIVCGLAPSFSAMPSNGVE